MKINKYTKGLFVHIPFSLHFLRPNITRPEVSGGGPQETIVLRCNKLNPGSTEIFEIEVSYLDLYGKSVPSSQECVHKNSEGYFI